ncbi:coiled-coil domain-containing protein 122-like [Argopecten irradians]|uniref:coiled-coil domain-containing protein 122-like n=1 Tax=Argopecten irradians TaxID=31199 RepID=UPI00371EAB3F
MEMRIPKICIPNKTTRSSDEQQTCITLPKTTTNDSETDSVLTKTSIATANSRTTGKQSVIRDWQIASELDGDVITSRDDDERMSDEDAETYAVVIDDTLSTGSSPPESRCDGMKSEVIDKWGDALPYNTLLPFPITQEPVNTDRIAEGMTYHGDKPSYTSLSCLSPRSSFKVGQNLTKGLASCDIGKTGDTSVVKQEPVECSGQFTYSMSSLELESQMVDQAIGNLMTLPQAFNEVVESKRSQSAEIELQQQNLETVQKEYEKAVLDNKALKDEIASVGRDVVHTQHAVTTGEKQCEDLKQEIANQVSVCEDLQQTLRYKQEEYDLEKCKVDNYQLKIASYVRTVTEQESKSDTMIELRELEEDVKNLRYKKIKIESSKEEYSDMMTGQSEQQLADKLSQLEKELKTQTKAAQDQSKLTEDLLGQQRLLDQSVLVLHKRNAAQLTRLKRQLKEAQIRRRRWNDQITHLVNVISDLKKQLE